MERYARSTLCGAPQLLDPGLEVGGPPLQTLVLRAQAGVLRLTEVLPDTRELKAGIAPLEVRPGSCGAGEVRAAAAAAGWSAGPPRHGP
ncbi:MAG: hypothetical protein QOK40_1452 [Miltoncostaeaceae bacterium]|nr:hypothetical protein [Miltoncostaeaceae bacterium]